MMWSHRSILGTTEYTYEFYRKQMEYLTLNSNYILCYVSQLNLKLWLISCGKSCQYWYILHKMLISIGLFRVDTIFVSHRSICIIKENTTARYMLSEVKEGTARVCFWTPLLPQIFHVYVLKILVSGLKTPNTTTVWFLEILFLISVEVWCRTILSIFSI